MYKVHWQGIGVMLVWGRLMHMADPQVSVHRLLHWPEPTKAKKEVVPLLKISKYGGGIHDFRVAGMLGLVSIPSSKCFVSVRWDKHQASYISSHMLTKIPQTVGTGLWLTSSDHQFGLARFIAVPHWLINNTRSVVSWLPSSCCISRCFKSMDPSIIASKR